MARPGGKMPNATKGRRMRSSKLRIQMTAKEEEEVEDGRADFQAVPPPLSPCVELVNRQIQVRP